MSVLARVSSQRADAEETDRLQSWRNLIGRNYWLRLAGICSNYLSLSFNIFELLVEKNRLQILLVEKNSVQLDFRFYPSW